MSAHYGCMKRRQTEAIRRQLIKLLSDRQAHSGAVLADQLEISRAAIWKHIHNLQQCGLDIDSIRGQGYQLLHPVQLLTRQAVLSHISQPGQQLLSELDVVFQTDSTNQRLLDRLPQESIRGVVMLAEHQTASRGRQGKHWFSTMAGSINVSIGWHFHMPPRLLDCLSLACGVAVMQLFQQIGITGVGLKWPNDIYAGRQKLGGILVESRGESAGQIDVVIGIGLNITHSSVAAEQVPHMTDLQSLCTELPARDRIAGLLIDRILQMLNSIDAMNKADLLNTWRKYDCAKDQSVTIHLPDRDCSGVVAGIDEDGLLLMRINDRLEKFTAGEISFNLNA